MATQVFLSEANFGAGEMMLVEHGELRVTTFRYPSGVSALRMTNGQGELVLLPYQGQQIWSATFGGRNLTMRSMFDQPHPTQDYLSTYGGFLIHCGFTAMGVPGPDDSHPLHGELPNARYQSAFLEVGEDDQGAYIALGGQYRHTVAFSCNYLAEPLVKLRSGSSLFDISLKVTNLKRTPMEYMYLAHANFRPIDNGQLVYSAQATPATVRVRRSIPSHVTPGAGYVEFLEELAADPARHNLLAPGLAFDPEVVFFIDYQADADGWAHSLQIHPDGSADYYGHRPEQLAHGVRWICRTADQDALGLVLPATAEPEGYSTEKAKGNVATLAAGTQWRCDMRAGVLATTDVPAMRSKIEAIVGG